MRRAALPLAAAALAACFGLLSWSAALRESATFDEPLHIVSGWTLALTGRRPPAQPNPPLLLRWLALPLPPAAALKPHDDGGYRAAPRSYGLGFVYSNTVPPEVLLRRARAANLALGILLLLLTGWWAYRLGGAAAGLAALWLFAFMPPLLAHSHLATADIGNALLCTAALFLLWRGSRAPGAPAAAAAGLACGLALAGKYTAVLLLPLGAAYLFFWKTGKLKAYGAWGAAALLGLALGCLPLSPLDWLRTGAAVARELEAGHVTYLLGRVSGEGTWYYFPLALLLKTPLPALLLAGAGFYGAARPERREALLFLALPAAAWLLLGMVSNTQVGVRHLLPVYPLLCAWAGLAAARLWGTGRRSLRWGLKLLSGWLIAGTLAAAPWHLSYFNELAGGTAGGHRYLLDSNLDWGQGLKELGSYAAAKGAGHVYLSYFGCADPRTYGLKYQPVLNVSCARLPGDGPPPAGGRQLLAVSVTNRLGVYYTPRDLFGWLGDRRPERIAGNSIWVYDVTGDTEALKLLSAPGLNK